MLKYNPPHGKFQERRVRKKSKHLRNFEKKIVFFIFLFAAGLFFPPVRLILYPVRKRSGGIRRATSIK